MAIVLAFLLQLAPCESAKDSAAADRAVAIGLAAAQRAGDIGLQAKLLDCRADKRSEDGRDAEAERDYNEAAALARRVGDAGLEADAISNIGTIQYARGAMADALTNLQAAYRTNERLGRHKERLDSLAGIANVYADAQVAQYDRAIEYYRQLLDGYEKHGQPNNVADTLFNIGGTFEAKGDYAASEFNYRRALAAFERLQRPDDIAYTKGALGRTLTRQGRAREAIALFDEALAIYAKEGSTAGSAMIRQYRGIALRRLGRSAEAIRELAAARRHYEGQNNTRFLERNVDETALAYEQLGDWQNAYEFRKRHSALQLALSTSRRDEISTRLRVEFDAEKKEQENRALARENALRATALREAKRNQTLQIAVIALTALLAAALAVLFWRQVVNTQRMRSMAMTDELTRLPNRRHILAALDLAFAAAKRDRRPAAVIVFDIDSFKGINDAYGHEAGDMVLRAVAHRCRRALRPNDLIGRTGGEEFLVVLQDPSVERAGEIAERLRSTVEATHFLTISQHLRVTISLGVWITEHYDPAAAIAAADELLYRAKEAGRNRVEMNASTAGVSPAPIGRPARS